MSLHTATLWHVKYRVDGFTPDTNRLIDEIKDEYFSLSDESTSLTTSVVDCLGFMCFSLENQVYLAEKNAKRSQDARPAEEFFKELRESIKDMKPAPMKVTILSATYLGIVRS